MLKKFSLRTFRASGKNVKSATKTNILVINSGSSSVKYKLFAKQEKSLVGIAEGMIEKIGLPSSGVKNHKKAVLLAIEELQKNGAIQNKNDINCIGHRVVHGGKKYTKPQKIDKKFLKEIEQFSPLAPLHNPANLEGIRICQKYFKKIPQYAVFDTAFHQTMPEKAFRYALPEALCQKYGIRKYGFHGISHEYVSQKAIQYLKKNHLPHEKIISCHLGNGVSITAIEKGKSIDTSMGFTPLEGVPMGTRSGSIDPSIVLFLQKKGYKKIEHLLNYESGLLALSEISSDMRIIHEKAQKGIKKALQAIEMYSYHIAKNIGGFMPVLNGLDCLIFTGGIGENAWYIRQNICNALKYFNGELNPLKNKKNAFEISTKKSKIKILVIPTDEKLGIAEKICYHNTM